MVYGSLRREFSSTERTVLDDHTEFAGEATFQGKLYKIDWYPGVVESDDPDDVVVGEVYKMMNEEIVFKKLDRYEGCSPVDPQPQEFFRKEMQVRLQNGKETLAWVYLYRVPLSEDVRIYSGDFMKDQEET